MNGDAVAEAAARVVGVAAATVVRYERDGGIRVVGSFNASGFGVGSAFRPERSDPAARILEHGGADRADDYSTADGAFATAVRASGMCSTLAVPVFVDRAIWGLVCAGATAGESLPTDAAQRLEELSALLAGGIAAAQLRERLRWFESEHAAVRRIATLVTREAPAAELFAAVVQEVITMLDVPGGWLYRYEPDQSVSVLASSNIPGYPVGGRYPLDGPSVAAMVLETGESARIDDYSVLTGTLATRAAESGFQSAVGIPVVVDGAVWGMLCVGATDSESLPADTEDRLREFTELVGAAISRTQEHDDLLRLADEQPALRRVATLVAQETTTEALFSAVCAEVGNVLAVPATAIERYDPDGHTTVLATWGDLGLWAQAGLTVGSRWSLDGPSVAQLVLETGRPAMISDYTYLPGTIAAQVRATPGAAWVGVPIIVEGDTWGVIYASTSARYAATAARSSARLPEDLDTRLAGFTELIATAVKNVEVREAVRVLLDEQNALGHIATLVARGEPARVVFEAICEETGQLVEATTVDLARFTHDGHYVWVAAWSLRDTHIELGVRAPLAVDSITAAIWRTGKPARRDSYEGATGEVATLARRRGIRSAVGVPIVVQGRLWGAVIPGRDYAEPFPAGTEERVARFAELAATGISNASARSDLIASRARIVAAGDQARRRIERNLHDGIQQRVLALGLDLQTVRTMVPSGQPQLETSLSSLGDDIDALLDDVREVSRGLHPSLLSRGGLRTALGSLANRSSIPVRLDIDAGERPPEPIESAVYYVVAEALTNAARYSRASAVTVTVTLAGPRLRATIEDDGVGGADPRAGTGLTGLGDRVEALGGKLSLESPAGGGTAISVELMVDSGDGGSGETRASAWFGADGG